MQLSTEDKERIKQEARNYSAKTYGDSDPTTIKDYVVGAERATIYEREKQVSQMMYANDTILKQATYIRELEAKRSELRNKVIEECIEAVKAENLRGLFYIHEWNGFKEELKLKLNSLKTK